MRTISEALLATLSPDNNERKNAEIFLKCRVDKDTLFFCLRLVNDSSSRERQLNQTAQIYIKNMLEKSYNSLKLDKEEKDILLDGIFLGIERHCHLCEIEHQYNNNKINSISAATFGIILKKEKSNPQLQWQALVMALSSLENTQRDNSKILAGVLALAEISRNSSKPLYQLLPQLITVAYQIKQQSSNSPFFREVTVWQILKVYWMEIDKMDQINDDDFLPNLKPWTGFLLDLVPAGGEGEGSPRSKCGKWAMKILNVHVEFVYSNNDGKQELANVQSMIHERFCACASFCDQLTNDERYELLMYFLFRLQMGGDIKQHEEEGVVKLISNSLVYTQEDIDDINSDDIYELFVEQISFDNDKDEEDVDQLIHQEVAMKVAKQLTSKGYNLSKWLISMLNQDPLHADVALRLIINDTKLEKLIINDEFIESYLIKVFDVVDEGFLVGRACEVVDTILNISDSSASKLFDKIMQLNKDLLWVKIWSIRAIRTLFFKPFLRNANNHVGLDIVFEMIMMNNKVDIDIYFEGMFEQLFEWFEGILRPHVQLMALQLSQQFSQVTRNNDLDKATSTLNAISALLYTFQSEITQEVYEIIYRPLESALTKELGCEVYAFECIKTAIAAASNVITPMVWKLFEVCIQTVETNAVYSNEFIPELLGLMQELLVNGGEENIENSNRLLKGWFDIINYALKNECLGTIAMNVSIVLTTSLLTFKGSNHPIIYTAIEQLPFNILLDNCEKYIDFEDALFAGIYFSPDLVLSKLDLHRVLKIWTRPPQRPCSILIRQMAALRTLASDYLEQTLPYAKFLLHVLTMADQQQQQKQDIFANQIIMETGEADCDYEAVRLAVEKIDINLLKEQAAGVLNIYRPELVDYFF